MQILLADDHDLFRAGLGMVLLDLGEETQLLQAASLTDALHCAETAPDLDLALLDLNMPAMDGVAGLRQFRARFPDVPVTIVSGSDEPADAQAALDAGAAGFIHKSTPPPVMLSALRLILAGGVYIPPHMLNRMAVKEPAPAVPEHKGWTNGLTMRQTEVLRLLAEGKPNKVIARELDLSEGTVKIHLSAIFRVLDVNNRTEAVLAAQKISAGKNARR